MSIEAMNWALNQQTGSAGAKAVLLILANRANQNGRCWPGIDGISEQTELGRRTVIAKIKELETAGFLCVTHRGGSGSGRKSNVYELHIAAKCHNDTLQDMSKSPDPHADSQAHSGIQATDSPPLQDHAKCHPDTLGQCADPAGQCADPAGQCAAVAPEPKDNPKKNPKNGRRWEEIDGLNMQAWDSWMAYRRRSKRKTYTTDLKARELAALPPDKQLECVNDSIGNEYAGLFPNKFKDGGGKKTYYEELADGIAKLNHNEGVPRALN